MSAAIFGTTDGGLSSAVQPAVPKLSTMSPFLVPANNVFCACIATAFLAKSCYATNKNNIDYFFMIIFYETNC
jgi:hypothetical protein